MARTNCFKLLAVGVLLGAALAGGVACVPCSATPAAAGADESPQASTGSDQQAPPKDEKLQEEIKKLIEQLGGQSFAVREKATERLAEIGIPALQALKMAENNQDLEIRTRAMNLSMKIRVTNRLPTLVKGVEFKLTLESSALKISKGAKKDEFKIYLEITNKSDSVYRFSRKGSSRILLRDAKGTQIQATGVSQKTAGLNEDVYTTLATNQSSFFAWRAWAITQDKKTFDLFIMDERGLVVDYSGLPYGIYQVAAGYENWNTDSHDNAALWMGRAHTLFEDITILAK